MPERRSHVSLQVLFGFMLGSLGELVGYVLMHRLAISSDGREVIAEDAGLQCPFVSVESGAPGILFVGSIAVGTVLPHHAQIGKIERGSLRVRDIRLAGFVHQNAATRRDSLGPAQPQHPRSEE